MVDVIWVSPSSQIQDVHSIREWSEVQVSSPRMEQIRSVFYCLCFNFHLVCGDGMNVLYMCIYCSNVYGLLYECFEV